MRCWRRSWTARRPATTCPRALTRRWRTSGWPPRSSSTRNSRPCRQGLVAARVVEQDRRPNKRVYRLTEAGLAALREFTAQPAKVTAIRDELLVKVQAVDVGDREA